MEILINGHPVEFTLDGEKTVKDVFNSINEWARSRELIFSSITVDDNVYYPDSVPDLELAGVKAIDCQIQSKSEIVFSSVDEGVRYSSRADQYIKDSIKSGSIDMGLVKDLHTGTEWLWDLINNLTGLIEADPSSIKVRDTSVSEYLPELKRFAADLGSLSDSDKVLKRLAQDENIYLYAAEALRALLLSDEMKELITKSIDSPDALMQGLHDLKDSLSGQIDNIQDAAIAFQTGRDREAIERFGTFIDFVSDYIRTCYQASPVFDISMKDIVYNGISLEETNAKLQDLLNQTIQIMESSDMVSLADILEYEMQPAFQEIGVYLDLMIKTIQGK